MEGGGRGKKATGIKVTGKRSRFMWIKKKKKKSKSKPYFGVKHRNENADNKKNKCLGSDFEL